MKLETHAHPDHRGRRGIGGRFRVGGTPRTGRRWTCAALTLAFSLSIVRPAIAAASSHPRAAAPWLSSCRFRVVLGVDAQALPRSSSPASIDIDFQELLRTRRETGSFDEHTVEVFATSVQPRPVPHRLEPLYGATRATLHFVVPDQIQTNFSVYFDTVESRHGRPRRFHGLVGDGDRFSQGPGRREIAASHFDCFVDFDGDGDLDLFKGGVEPFVRYWENTGGNRLQDRGRLSSGGRLFNLPCSRANRSWVTVAFHDIDGDADPDFFPSFGDGPDAGKIVFYRNTTRESGGRLTFERVGPLQTVSGVALAGAAQAGGWFPSIAFAPDWDGDGRGPDALVGSNHRGWLHRNLAAVPQTGRAAAPAGATTAAEAAPATPLFSDAIALQAGGRDIELVNPRFDCADVDSDGDPDLFAGTQPGPVHWFENIGEPGRPQLDSGKVIAWSGRYLIGDAHSGVKLADFDGDGRPDLVSGRFWERADLNEPDASPDFGGFWRNVGARASPAFARRARKAPFTLQFQPCDAVRQNSVRAVDWDGDRRLDLLAGDTDGFIWFFRNLARESRGEEGRARKPERERNVGSEATLQASASTGSAWSVFAEGRRLRAGGKLLSVSDAGGHARFDVCDWDNDGRKDLVVASGSGALALFLNRGSPPNPSLATGLSLKARDGQPIPLGARASVLVCDWDNDGRKDLVLADDKGYYFCRNVGQDAAPLLAAPRPVTFGSRSVSYVRPNLGSFVDWDGDGKRDLIGCHFENSIRFYRNVGRGAPGEEPKFTDPEGVVLVQGESPQMISGASAVDWNGDGDLDLLTGQGHGGSGLRFYERDWIENNLRAQAPTVRIRTFERR